MQTRKRLQFGILGLLILTAVVAFSFRGIVAYFDRPNVFQAVHVLVTGQVDKESIGNAIAADVKVVQLLEKKQIRTPQRWIRGHVSISEIGGRSNERVLAIQINAKSWEFEPWELELIVDSAVNFIRTVPEVAEVSVLLTQTGKSF